jgi:hypothetical protein
VLAFTHELVHNEYNKPSCAELFKLIAYARKNSKRLLCGLFYGLIKANTEAKKGMTHEGQGKGDVKIINVEVQGGRGREVMVRHEMIPPKRKTWSYENVSREWNRTL